MASDTLDLEELSGKRSGESMSKDLPHHSNVSLNLSRIRPQPKRDTVEALERLSKLPKTPVDLTMMPRRRVAAVLVLLHVNPLGGLSVTLTTRSSRLRSHPGDTALPGGRIEDLDESIVATAFRESNEEIGLPLDNMEQYGFLGVLDPFVSRNLLIVYPVLYVLLIPAPGFLLGLTANEDEVAEIFHWPLEDMAPFISENQAKPMTHDLVYTYRDVPWMKSNLYRWHSFHHNSMPSPITGLTADILISVAMLAFDVKACKAIKASTQQDWPVLVSWALADVGGGPGDEHSLIRHSRASET
ncbi:NUDIX hydrolase domain-like protein [Melampsora americana]|nr:NUDIX hydrolase domain-like protein [Melampsora americana]